MGNSESQPEEDTRTKKIEDRIQEARNLYSSNFKKSYDLLKGFEREMQDFNGSKTTLLQSSSGNKEDEYWSMLASCYYKVSKFKQALAIHEDRLLKNPDSTKHLKEAGDCERHLQRYPQSRLRYKAALTSISTLKRSQVGYKQAQVINSWGLSFLAEGTENAKDAQNLFHNACQKFQDAIKKDSKNPLYLCHAGAAYSALGKRQQAVKRYRTAVNIFSQESEEELSTFLSKNNIKFVKRTLKDFVESLMDLYSKNITKDKTLKERVNRFGMIPVQVQQNTAENTPIKQDQHKHLSDTQEKMVFIEKNQLLLEFYSGLNGYFQLQYQQAGTIMSQIITKKTQSIAGILASNLALYFLGPIAALAVDKISNCINQQRIQMRAKNLRALRFIPEKYKSLMQDVSIEITLKVKDILPIIDTKQTFIAWCDTLNSIIEKLLEKKQSAKALLFGNDPFTEMQRFGSRIAIELIANHVANGDLYGERKPIQIPDDQLKCELTSAALTIFQKSRKIKKEMSLFA